MYKFSKKSESILKDIHPYLKLILNKAIKITDFSIIEGFRTQERQTMLFAQGKTKVNWPNSKHNRTLDKQFESIEFNLCDAVDIAPYPSLYSDPEQIAYLNGVITGVASDLGVKLRTGADWNRDGELNNGPNDFFDPLHIEILHN